MNNHHTDTSTCVHRRNHDLAARSQGEIPPGWRDRHTVGRALTELFVVSGMLVAYRTGRQLSGEPVDTALANAGRVLQAQRVLLGHIEQNVQRFLLEVPGAIALLNHYYVLVHFPATAAFFVWTFVCRRERYDSIRNWFALVTGAALAIHIAFPLAPPRMLDGYTDTLRMYGPSIYPDDVRGVRKA